MAAEASLTSKGQTTIPKEVRDQLSLQPGDRLRFTVMPDGAVILRVKNRSVRELFGLVKGSRRVGLAEMRRR